MHKEARQYVEKIKAKHPDWFKGKRVVEFGSLNINGTIRDLFEDCNYIGVDWRYGKDVDCKCLAHKFMIFVDVNMVITMEMLEHDKFAKESLLNAYYILKKGGVIIGTAANINRKPHELYCGINDYYENITREFLESFGFDIEIEEDREKKDIYFIIRK